VAQRQGRLVSWVEEPNGQSEGRSANSYTHTYKLPRPIGKAASRITNWTPRTSVITSHDHSQWNTDAMPRRWRGPATRASCRRRLHYRSNGYLSPSHAGNPSDSDIEPQLVERHHVCGSITPIFVIDGFWGASRPPFWGQDFFLEALVPQGVRCGCGLQLSAVRYRASYSNQQSYCAYTRSETGSWVEQRLSPTYYTSPQLKRRHDEQYSVLGAKDDRLALPRPTSASIRFRSFSHNVSGIIHEACMYYRANSKPLRMPGCHDIVDQLHRTLVSGA
jgi:hypothetical protein